MWVDVWVINVTLSKEANHMTLCILLLCNHANWKVLTGINNQHLLYMISGRETLHTSLSIRLSALTPAPYASNKHYQDKTALLSSCKERLAQQQTIIFPSFHHLSAVKSSWFFQGVLDLKLHIRDKLNVIYGYMLFTVRNDSVMNNKKLSRPNSLIYLK